MGTIRMVNSSTVAIFISTTTLLFVIADIWLKHLRQERSDIDVLNRVHASSKYNRISNEGVHYLKIQNNGSRPGIIIDHSIKRVYLIDRDKGKKIRANLESYNNLVHYEGLEQQKTVPSEYIGHITATSGFKFDIPQGFTRSYDEVEVLLEFRIEDHVGTYTVKYWDLMKSNRL